MEKGHSPKLGLRLTVQCDDPDDMYYRPQDFFPSTVEGICIGRAGGNDIQLSNAGVSGVHCRIFQEDGELVLEDTGGRNGTFVGGQRLDSGEQRRLRYGDVIRVLNYHITLQPGLSAFAPDSEDGEEDTLQIERDVVQMFLDDPDQYPPQLEVTAGPRTGLIVELGQYKDLKIGRGSTAHIVLPDDGISREHALIRRDWTGVTVRDLNSRNGVSLNGRRLERNVEVKLSDGDEIGLGHNLLIFRDPFGADFSDKLQGLVDFELSDDGSIDGDTIAPQLLTKQKDPGEEPSSGTWRSPEPEALEAAPLEEESSPTEEGEDQAGDEENSEEEESAKQNTPSPVSVKTKLGPIQILLIFLLSLLGLTLIALMLSLLIYSS